jgi:molybdopterin-guanine dinucleotide biosynthesis protein A
MKLSCAGRPVSLIVLAGGKSRRMRTDKARLPLPGGTLVERVLAQVESLFDEILISVSRAQAGAFPGRRTVVDDAEGLGPMAGILAGLKTARNETCVVLACDIPDIDTKLLRSLVGKADGREIVVPVTPEGFLEPLFAVYSRRLTPRIEESLRSGEYSLLPVIEGARTLKVKLGKKNRVRNLNTPEDYEDYLRSLRARPATGPPSGKAHKIRTVPAPRRPSSRPAPARPVSRKRVR